MVEEIMDIPETYPVIQSAVTKWNIVWFLFGFGLYVGFFAFDNVPRPEEAEILAVEHSTVVPITSTFQTTSLQPTQPSHAPRLSRNNLCYEHLPKSGGTFIRKILRAMNLPKCSPEFQHTCNREKEFIIGNLQDVCTYYISTWSFGCENSNNNGAIKIYWMKQRAFKKRVYEDSFNTTNFELWLRYVADLNTFGLYSYRLIYHYDDGPRETLPFRGMMVDVMKTKRDKTEDETALKRLSLTDGKVDCFVDKDNMKEDLRHCLKRFESQRSDGKILNWDKFENASTTSNHNPSSHGPCQDYWNQDLKDWIYQKDKIAIDNLKLTCCGEPFT